MSNPSKLLYALAAGLLGALFVPLGEPARAGGKTAGATVVAKCVKVHGALVERSGPDKPWNPVHEKTDVRAGATLVALPAAELVSANGAVGLEMVIDVSQRGPLPVMESAVVLHASADHDLDLTFDRGIIVLENLRKTRAAKVRLRVRGQTWELTLRDPGAKIVTELHGRHVPGTRLPLPDVPKGTAGKDNPITEVYVLALKGRAQLHVGERTYGLEAPPGHALFHWDSVDGDLGLQRLDKLPEGVGKLDPKGVKLAKMICDAAHCFAEKPTAAALDGLSKSGNELERRLGVVAAGALDDLPRLIDALSNPKDAEVRNTAVKAMRHWIGRGPGQAGKFYDALTKDRKYAPALVRTVLQGLVGFSEQQEMQPTLYDFLITLLDHKELPIRELARWHLYRLAPAGADIPYDAAAAPEMRRDAQQRWRTLIPEGQLPPPLKKGTGK